MEYKYQDYYTVESALYTGLREKEGKGDLTASLSRDHEERLSRKILSMIRQAVWSGEYEAIGCPKINGLSFAYERIPSWKWEYIDLQFGVVRYFNSECGSIKLKQKEQRKK